MKDILEIDNTVEVLHSHILNTWDKMHIPHLYLQQFVKPKEIFRILG
jgi:hypothetical protein